MRVRGGRDCELEAAVLRLARHFPDWTRQGLHAAVMWHRPDSGWGPGTDVADFPADAWVTRAQDADRTAVAVSAPQWPAELSVLLCRDGTAQVAFASGAGSAAERARRIGDVGQWEAMVCDAVARAPGMRVQHCQLLARSCTTSWTDWIHGELWIMPDCLIRVRSGVGATVLQAYGSYTSAKKAGRTLAYDPAELAARHATNRVIPLRGIARASFRTGYSTTSFTMDMSDGSRQRLLWRREEPARRLLTDRLLPLLGPRLAQ